MADNAKPCILHDNRFLDGTPTASGTATGYDVLNIRDLRPFTWWQAGTPTNMEDNGDAWTGASGATPPNNWTAVNAGTHSLSGGYLVIARNATNNPGIKRTFTVEVGKVYTISVLLRNTAGAATYPYCAAGTTDGGTDYGVIAQPTVGAGIQTITFQATETTLYVALVVSTTVVGSAMFDYFKLYQNSTITVDCGTASAADTLAMIGHNLYTTYATIYIQSSPDDSTWTDEITPFIPASDRAIFKTFTKGTARYWRIIISSVSATAAQIAVCLLGVRMDFERFPAGNFDPAPEKVNGIAARSKAGHMIGATLQNVGIEIRADFKSLTPAWIEATFRPAWDAHLSQLLPFFFAWDTVNHPTEVYFVTIPEGFDLRMPFDPYRRSLSLTMEGVKET